MSNLTQERLRELLCYNPETGSFTWLRSRGNKRAGQFAGSTKIRIDGLLYYAHNLAWLFMTGILPKFLVLFEDGNRSNLKWNNLREGTFSNAMTRKKKPANNTSGFKGVSWNRQLKVYTAQISPSGKRVYLGCFKSKELAHEAYACAAVKYFGDHARP